MPDEASSAAAMRSPRGVSARVSSAAQRSLPKCRAGDFVADRPESALCRYAVGPTGGDQKQGKPYSDGRSGWFLFRRDDRAAQLTHEDSQVVGTTLLRNLRSALILHTDTVIGNNQLNLIADPFHAQHDMSCPLWKSMLDGVRRKLIDQKAEGYGTIGVDFQRLGLNLNFDT